MRSGRNTSTLMSFTAVLTMVAFTLSTLGAELNYPVRLRARSLGRPQAPQMSTMAMMPLVAPLFIQDQDFTSTLVLVNGSNLNTYADVTVAGLDGQEIMHQRVQFPPHGQRRVELSTLLKSAGSRVTTGRIEIMHSPALKAMSILASLSITYSGSGEPSYIDEEISMPSAESSQTLRAVADATDGPPLVAITSLSTASQNVTVKCFSQGATTSKTVDLRAEETLLTEACGERTVHGGDFETVLKGVGDGPRGPAGIGLTSDASPGSFAAFGLTPHRKQADQFFSGISFDDPKMAMSTTKVFAGIPVGKTTLLPDGDYVPQLALANFSTKELHVRVEYAQTSGNGPIVQDVASAMVPAGTTKGLTLDAVQGDPDLKNSFLIISDGVPGDLIAKLVSTSGPRLREVESEAKDEKARENGGNHPWSLDEDTESTLLLFNHSAEPRRFNVGIASGDVVWQKVYELAPMQTEAISIRSLIQDRVKDDGGRTMPRDILSGTVDWYTFDLEVGSGRILQSSRQLAMARNFGCVSPMALCVVYIQPATISLVAGQTVSIAADPYICNVDSGGCNGDPAFAGPGNASNPHYHYSWSVNDAASISGPNTSDYVSLYGASGGTGTLFLQVIDDAHGCDVGNQASVTVQPAITGPNTVWYFGGQNPSGYATSITLTSSSGSSTTWTVTAGSNKVNLSTTTGSQTTITSSGTAFSSSVGDIGMKATAGGVDSAVFTVTSRKPYFMSPNTGLYVAGCPDSSQGYVSKVYYTIEDQLSAVLPSNVPQNEFWTSLLQKDYPGGTNWVQNTAQGSVVGPVNWFDMIGAYTGTGAMPTVNCSGPHTAVVHWGQQWRFGSTASGQGQLVQADTLQKYLDDTNHTSVVSPQ
jgi:hypothetical protein